MRRIALGVMSVLLGVVLAARAAQTSDVPALAEAAAMVDSGQYNLMDLDLSVTTETAGSALIAQMNSHYLTRTPTAKNQYTGLLAGKDLILILAESWQPDTADMRGAPALYRLRSEGAGITSFYTPDWYQGADGRTFALLTGLTPTTVENSASLAWVAEQSICLPFTAARCLAGQGYVCQAVLKEQDNRGVYISLGFSAAEVVPGSDLDAVSRTLPDLLDGGPFFVYYVWDDAGEEALTWLLDALDEAGRAADTAVCLLTGDRESLRGSLFLWGPGLEGAGTDIPCSELDVTPTLLNLFGLEYDSRFLTGRDIFSPADGPEMVSAAMPLVPLYGSAYADWVTDAGHYRAGEAVFFPAGDIFSGSQETARYVRQVCRLVYERYTFDRRAVENNYFRIVLGP